MKIPKNKSEILVKTYLKYEEFIKNEENIKDEEILKNVVKIFYDVDDEYYDKLTYKLIIDLNKNIEKILKQDQKLILKFKYKGKLYGINPNFDDMSFAEMVDCDTNDILKQISILYRPVIKKRGKKYLIEPYKADIQIYDYMKEWLTLDIYFGFINFFLQVSSDLMKSTLNYLVKEQGITQEQKKILQTNGAGYRGLINSARVI